MRLEYQIAFAAALASGISLPASSQTLLGRTDSVYTWRGSLGARALLTVKNFNGPIEVRPASGSQVEFRAEKRTSRGGGDIQDVAFEVRGGGSGDITICATYRRNNPCDDHGWRNDDDDRTGNHRWVTVAMTVMIPKGTQLKIATGNGEVSIGQVTGDLQATTGNGKVSVSGADGTVRVSTGNGDVEVRDAKGSVKVSTGNGRVNVITSDGPVDVHTGNGEINVQMSRLKAADDMVFSTGSGSVRVTLPEGYNGDLDASTGNGSIRSDFDLRVEGRLNPRRIRATIGTGGPKLRLVSGNGTLEIRKG